MARWVALLIAATMIDVAVRVVDERGEPVLGVHVSFYPSPKNAAWGVLLAAESSTTAADGSCQTKIEPGNLDIALYGPIVPQQLRRQEISAEKHALEFTVDRGVPLSGRVIYRDGSAITKKASVSIQGSSPPQVATTDADGAFAFEHVTRGKRVLRAEIPGLFVIDSGPSEATAPSSDVVLTVRKPGRVEGFVRARDGQPVPSEFGIEVDHPDGKRTRWFRLTGGQFAVEVPPGRIDLTARAEAYSSAAVHDIVVKEAGLVKAGIIELDRKANLYGRITGPDRAPLKAAGVTLLRDEQPVGHTTTSDAGEYTMEADAGDYTAEIERKGFLRRRELVALTAGKFARLDAALDRGMELRGYVVDASSGQSIPDAAVSVNGDCCETAVSARDGSFAIIGMEKGHYDFRAKKKGYLAKRLPIDVPSPSLRVELARGGVITGTIRGVAPADRAKLKVQVLASEPQYGEIDAATGAFRIEGVSDGKARVLAMVGDDRFRSRLAEVEVVNGEGGPVEIDFADGARISGHVTLNGVPVDGTVGVAITSPLPFFGQSVQTRGGYYEATLTGKGACGISFSMPDGRRVYNGKTVVTGDTTYDIDIRGATLTGRVTDQTTGFPLVGVKVSIGTLASETQLTDGAGMYAFDLLPDGYRTVTAQPDHYVSKMVSVKVADGRAPATDLALTPAEAAVLRIVDAANGRPVSASVVLTGEGTAHQGRADGGTLMVWVAPGTYKAIVENSEYAKVCGVPVTVPGPETTISLSRGGTAVIRSNGSNSASWARLVPRSGNRDCSRSGMSDGKSAVVILHVAAGEYVVEVSGGREYAISIVDGRTTTMTID
jgi:hypothetical protein